MEEQQPVNILCLKWGTRYPASFTNILYASVNRHLHRPFRFVCVTDDPNGLAEGIDARPFPENPRPDLMDKWPNIFIKLCVFYVIYLHLPPLFSEINNRFVMFLFVFHEEGLLSEKPRGYAFFS